VRIGGPRKRNQQADLPRLVYRTSHGVETEFILTEQITKIGRRASNHIRLNCLQISKEHAAVEKTNEGYVVPF
jgi:pSer/pThr/pTyr-binding forkhead associated (FHA) protein